MQINDKELLERLASKSAGFKAVLASSLFSLASLLNAEAELEIEKGRGLQECLSHRKKGMICRAWQGGVGWGTAVGGTLRNAWKVSAKSGRLWTDYPLHHNALCLKLSGCGSVDGRADDPFTSNSPSGPNKCGYFFNCGLLHLSTTSGGCSPILFKRGLNFVRHHSS